VLFIADDDETSGEALGAGCPRGGKAGQRGTYDRKRLHFLHPLSIAFSATTIAICNSVIQATVTVKGLATH
jgi:hypothetical protein